MQSLCCEQCSRTQGIREATSITNTTVLHDVRELGPVEKVCRRNRGSEGTPICIACHCKQRNNYNISSHLYNNIEKSGEHHEHRVTWVPYRCWTDIRQRRAMRETIFCAKLLRLMPVLIQDAGLTYDKAGLCVRPCFVQNCCAPTPVFTHSLGNIHGVGLVHHPLEFLLHIVWDVTNLWHDIIVVCVSIMSKTRESRIGRCCYADSIGEFGTL